MRIKLITSVGGMNFSYQPMEIVEIEDAEAARWIAAGFAFPVPDFEASAEKVHDLTKQLADMTGKYDGIAATKTDLEGKLAAAMAEKKGAMAETAIHRKAAEGASARIVGLEKELAAALAAGPALAPAAPSAATNPIPVPSKGALDG